MKISVLTLFPEMFQSVLSVGLLNIAQQKERIEVALYNIRDFAENKHRQADDYSFGGGPGMLMMPQPAIDAMLHVMSRHDKPHRIYLSPRGKVLTAQKARQLAQMQELILLCGHYEGMDERVVEGYIDEEVSIGDYVLSGGELPAMVLLDAVARYMDGVLGNEQSAQSESLEAGLLEYPQYTRPADFRGMQVPEVLLSGNHAEIEKWRRRQSLLKTRQNRPDLLQKAELTEEEQRWLESAEQPMPRQG